METTGISLGEAMTLCNNNNGYGNNAMWNNPFMYLMWASMFGGGGAFPFGNRYGGGDYVNQAQLAQGLDNQDKNSQLRGIANGLADLGYAMTNNIKDGNAAVAKTVSDVGVGLNKSITDLGAGVAMGFCNTNHNIDNLKYENAKNTADIIASGHADTQRILDKMCAAETNALRQELADAKLNLSQAAQSAYLVEKLTPAT